MKLLSGRYRIIAVCACGLNQTPLQTMASSKRQYQSNRLRIISGRWGGRQLTFPASAQLRPTPDNVRETLFNWLAPWVNESRCLDLYAGSGAIGLEALSRGASHVTFVEQNRRAAQAISAHLNDLEATQQTAVMVSDAIKSIKGIATGLDLVFLDPPFGEDLVQPTLDELYAADILNPDALVYVEHEKPLNLDLGADWEIWREKSHGGATSLLLTPIVRA